MSVETLELSESQPFNSIKIVESKPSKKLKLIEVKIDSQTILRKRVEVTPTMCDSPRCDFDIAIANGYVSHSHVPVAILPALIDALKEHKTMVHSYQTQDVIDESDIQNNDRWLGQFKTF